MANYYKTRTVRTYVDDGKGGAPKVETKTFTIGGPGGSNIGFTPNASFGNMGNIGSMADFDRNFSNMGGQFNIGFGDNFGGGRQPIKFNVGGGVGGGASPHSVISRVVPSPGQVRVNDPTPKLPGRKTRSDAKNPFQGLKLQNAAEIRQKCQQEGILFQDPEFPCENSSIFFSRPPPRNFEWRRPHEICDNPQWIADGASRFDVRQGELGDCWLLAAVASLTCNQKLFNKVVDPSQNFTDGYCGLFRFNFWHQGDWQEVVVDDRLPTYRGQLVFMHSTEKNEFWSALLEKAYAKLMGSYESLKGGSTSEAMEDFTGGVTEMFDLQSAPPNLLKIMMKAYERGSLMGCSIDADPHRVEAELDNGLVMGHAYSVTAVKLVSIDLNKLKAGGQKTTPGGQKTTPVGKKATPGGKKVTPGGKQADVKTRNMEGQIPLVRIRNPWGNGKEWTGAWSDSSREWTLLSPDEKAELGLSFDDDGEFWMSFKDFTDNFQKLEICNLGPDSLDEEDLSNKKKWECHKSHGQWIKRVSAGGCRNFLETFWTNPQFRMTLTDVDDDDDEDLCTALIAVLQKDRRKKRKQGVDLLTIGYVIYKLDNPDADPLDMNFFKYNASVAKSPTFINMREVCGRHKLPSGTYAIIPSTFDPNNEGDFMVRIFSEKPNISNEIDETTSFNDDADAQGGGNERPPPTAEDNAQLEALRESFRVTAGEDMEVDAYELQDILNAVFTKHFDFPGFGIDTCRSMVAMHDGDLSGKLGFDEFKELWDDLRRWKGVFKEFDKDGSGFLSSIELRQALNHVGFRISNCCFRSIVMRYSNKDGQVNFGDFILCAIRLKCMLTSFKGHDPQNTGFAPYKLDQFIQTTMYS